MLTVVTLACIALSVSPAVQAHLETDLAGALNGTLIPASPTFNFKGEAAFAGRYNGQPSVAHYACVASGPNAGITPWGGPFEGTYTCNAIREEGAAPASVSGPLKGYTNLVTVAMSGTFESHRVNCTGTVYPVNVTPGLGVQLGVAMSCVVQ